MSFPTTPTLACIFFRPFLTLAKNRALGARIAPRRPAVGSSLTRVPATPAFAPHRLQGRLHETPPAHLRPVTLLNTRPRRSRSGASGRQGRPQRAAPRAVDGEGTRPPGCVPAGKGRGNARSPARQGGRQLGFPDDAE